MKKLTTTLLLLSIVVFLSACGEGKINQSDNNSTMPIGQAAARNNGGDADSFISKDYRDKNELYGFIKTFLDYKEPAMEALEARKNDFTDTVSGLAGGDWAIDIPIDPLKRLLTLEKSGSSWEGEVIAFGYEIKKSGDVYAFKFTHTMLDKVMEGTCNIKTGVLQGQCKRTQTCMPNSTNRNNASDSCNLLPWRKLHLTLSLRNDFIAARQLDINRTCYAL